jgi:hypothetical protein
MMCNTEASLFLFLPPQKLLFKSQYHHKVKVKTSVEVNREAKILYPPDP